MSSVWLRFLLASAILYDCGASRLVSAEPTKDVEEVSVACLYIDRCLARLEKEKPEDLLGDRVISIISSAERTLPVFWGVDPEALTKATREKVDAYPAKIRGWFDKINEQKSQGLLKEVVKVRLDLSTWRGENKQNAETKWQDYIDRTNAASTKMQKLIASMSPGVSQEKAVELLTEVQYILNWDNRNQLSAYQKRALERCHGFATFVLTYTIRKDDTLLAQFNEREIMKIDTGLLSSDSRRIYEIAVGMMDEKLKERHRASFLLKLTETEKWKLSDF